MLTRLAFSLAVLLAHVSSHGTHTANTTHSTTSGGFVYTSAPNMALLQNMKAQVRTLLNANTANHGTLVQLIPKYVRLVFHDCVGGCDGCINLNNPSNRGLNHLTALDKLNQIYDTYFNTSMSRADFWVTAATISLEYGVELAANASHTHRRRLQHAATHTSHFSYTWGRRDCATSPTTTAMHTFPSGIGNTHHVLHFFQNEFNLTAKETVALMGAHTLGRAVTLHTGFNGPWTTRQDAVDNVYYKNLLNMMWMQGHPPVDNVTGHAHRRLLSHSHGAMPVSNVSMFQWNNHGKTLMMINADMALVRQFTADSITGHVNCTFKGNHSCANASTIGFVEMYANNNMMWLMDFAAVWAKITSKGAHQLYPVTANSSLPSSCIGTSLCQTTTAAPSKAGRFGAASVIINIFVAFVAAVYLE